MGYIYCITNLINRKKYVGKTTSTIEKRFKEHCRDSRKERCNKRPLYDAMNKYGIENFKIDKLEYIKDDNLLANREKYWIKKLNTWGHTGYNASKGGDGKILYNYKEIINLYRIGYSQKQISEKIGCCTHTISKILKTNNIVIRGGRSKIILQFDKQSNYIQRFNNSTEAIRWLINNHLAKNKGARNHIIDCCNNKTKYAYGYIWKYNTFLSLAEAT